MKNIKSFELFNEAVSNEKETNYILNNIVKYISKKYEILDYKIETYNLVINFKTDDIKNNFLNDEKFQKAIEDKFQDFNTSLILTRRMNNVNYHIKNLMIKRVKPSRYLYHVSNIKNRKSILKNGLIPSKNTEDYGILNYNTPFIFASTKNLIPHNDNNDIWLIDTTDLNNKWYRDFNYSNDDINHVITDTPIPKSALKRITYKKFIKMNESYENNFYLYNDKPVFVNDIDYDLGDEIRVFYTDEYDKKHVYTSDYKDFETDFVLCSETDFNNKKVEKKLFNVVFYIGKSKKETLRYNVDKQTAYKVKNHFSKKDKYKIGKIIIE